jgi:shikimate kinase
MTNNIVLIGFMGVGKGSVARLLAEKTGRFAVDSDDLIESFSNSKVKKIFAQFGEPRFRKLEREVAVWLENSVCNTIISTGGGFLQVPNLSRIGTVIYLHSDFDQILEGITEHPNAKKKIRKRPLLQDVGRARKLLATRIPLYREAADYEVSVAGKSVEKIVQKIQKLIKKEQSKK